MHIHTCTAYCRGVYCKGQRTRLRNKESNKLIITRKRGQPIEKFVAAKKWRAAAEREKKVWCSSIFLRGCFPISRFFEGVFCVLWVLLGVLCAPHVCEVRVRRACHMTQGCRGAFDLRRVADQAVIE